MADNDLSIVIARALFEPEFRNALGTSPERTLKEAGLSLTSDQLEAVKKLRPGDWDKLALQEINSRIGMMAGKQVTHVVIED